MAIQQWRWSVVWQDAQHTHGLFGEVVLWASLLHTEMWRCRVRISVARSWLLKCLVWIGLAGFNKIVTPSLTHAHAFSRGFSRCNLPVPGRCPDSHMPSQGFVIRDWTFASMHLGRRSFYILGWHALPVAAIPWESNMAMNKSPRVTLKGMVYSEKTGDLLAIHRWGSCSQLFGVNLH